MGPVRRRVVSLGCWVGVVDPPLLVIPYVVSSSRAPGGGLRRLGAGSSRGVVQKGVWSRVAGVTGVRAPPACSSVVCGLGPLCRLMGHV